MDNFEYFESYYKFEGFLFTFDFCPKHSTSYRIRKLEDLTNVKLCLHHYYF